MQFCGSLDRLYFCPIAAMTQVGISGLSISSLVCLTLPMKRPLAIVLTRAAIRVSGSCFFCVSAGVALYSLILEYLDLQLEHEGEVTAAEDTGSGVQFDSSNANNRPYATEPILRIVNINEDTEDQGSQQHTVNDAVPVNTDLIGKMLGGIGVLFD